MYWQQHESFTKEFKKLARSISTLEEDFESTKRLLGLQFNLENPQCVITPAKLHRLHENDTWALWKLEMVVRNVRPNLAPRVWFVRRNSTIVFLSIATHSQNYNDNTQQQESLKRWGKFNQED